MAFLDFPWCARRPMFRYTREIPALCSIAARAILRFRSQKSPVLAHMFQKRRRYFLRVVVQVLIQILLAFALVECILSVFLLPLRLLEVGRQVCY